eukprot:SAG31_NODE_9_length_42330_cov_441.979162_12_plen_127_part_00
MGGGASKSAATVKVVARAKSMQANNIGSRDNDSISVSQQGDLWIAPEEQLQPQQQQQQQESQQNQQLQQVEKGGNVERESAPYSFVPVAPEPQVMFHIPTPVRAFCSAIIHLCSVSKLGSRRGGAT